jgi:hypothetical protein
LTVPTEDGADTGHLRICRHCGHVGCCDQSPGKHARKHFNATRHPIIEGYDPPEGWSWCYVDEIEVDLHGDTTPQDGPIARFVQILGISTSLEAQTTGDSRPPASG